MKAPCRECTDRYLGCHDHCEKFREFDKERKRVHDLVAKQHQTDYDYLRVRRRHLGKGYSK